MIRVFFFSSLPLFLTLILCYLYCLHSSHWGAHKIINMCYQHYWYGEWAWVVVMYFAKTVLAPYIWLDASVRHLCPILKCKCVMPKYYTTHSYILWNSVFHISGHCWGISVTHFDWYHPRELLLPTYQQKSHFTGIWCHIVSQKNTNLSCTAAKTEKLAYSQSLCSVSRYFTFWPWNTYSLPLLYSSLLVILYPVCWTGTANIFCHQCDF